MHKAPSVLDRQPAPAVNETNVTATLHEQIAAICARIPPLWDLNNYVAVNPFLGFAGDPIPLAAQQIRDGLSGRLLPELAFYQKRWQAGAFNREHLTKAADRTSHDLAELEALLVGTARPPLRASQPVLAFAERYDQRCGTDWHNTIVRHAALWCAVQIPANYQHGAAPAGQGLYAAWREAAQIDRALELAGLPGWRAWVQALPATAEAAIAAMLTRLQVPPAEQAAYLYRLFSGVYGWACYLRRATWSAGSQEAGALADLLAIRICGDAAVAALAPATAAPLTTTFSGATVEDETVLAVLQEALEDGYAAQLLGRLNPPTPNPAQRVRPQVQAAFCIDVRSEPLRRQLEAQAETIQTLGFAGFFGVSLAWEADGSTSARCPVLIQPAVKLNALTAAAPTVGSLAKAMQQTPAAFTYVELLGLFYGLTLAGDALHWSGAPHNPETQAPFTLQPTVEGGGLPLAVRIAVAAGILKNMGLRDTFARLVLLCGHGSSSTNNAHAAGLECGACGGHSGALNSRVAAGLLNDPDVRVGLLAQGWSIPVDTYFVAGLHDTTLDQVTLLDTAQLPATHQADRQQLEQWLANAGAAVRAERAAGLGLTKAAGSWLDRLIQRRAQDWAEVRPEWALARNAAFLAARRSRTRNVDLQGRTFLHDYDWTTDPDNSILTLILSAPMVVASWINLQYFASTVDNELFGCGTKALHNRVGATGVVLGNGGDLRTGLALQSVHGPDGEWYHEPLRLQVVVEAPTARIDAVLAANPMVNNLVTNGWVRLFALERESTLIQQWTPAAGWQAVGGG